MKAVRLCVLFLLFSFAYGCVTSQKPMYYWGNYSSSLYGLKKNPGEETMNLHIKALDDIILKSKEMDLKVPPGIYAEYGMYLLQADKKAEAKEMFLAEKHIYPESSLLMDRMIKVTDTEVAKGEVAQ